MATGREITLAISCVVAVALAVLVGCGDSGGPAPATPTPVPAGETVGLEGGSTLVFQDSGRLSEHHARIEQRVREAVTAVRPLMGIDRATFLVLAGDDVIPEIGFGGFADASTVRLTFDPASTLLSRSLDTELFPLVLHELHHLARSRTIGYGSTLLEAMISEGLADQFSVELAGIEPPLWSSALEGDTLTMWLDRSRAEWNDAGYSHSAWFFGTAPPIPRWAGYAIGFELTGRYLRDHPGTRASGLVSEPATTFVVN